MAKSASDSDLSKTWGILGHSGLRKFCRSRLARRRHRLILGIPAPQRSETSRRMAPVIGVYSRCRAGVTFSKERLSREDTDRRRRCRRRRSPVHAQCPRIRTIRSSLVQFHHSEAYRGRIAHVRAVTRNKGTTVERALRWVSQVDRSILPFDDDRPVGRSIDRAGWRIIGTSSRALHPPIAIFSRFFFFFLRLLNPIALVER